MVQLGPSGRLITSVSLSITTTGGAGVSAGTAATGSLNGYLLDIYLNFHASAPATTDTTLSYLSPALGNILVITNSATDALYTPRRQCVDATGAAISGMFDLVPINGTLQLALAQCDDLTGAVVATIRYLQTA